MAKIDAVDHLAETYVRHEQSRKLMIENLYSTLRKSAAKVAANEQDAIDLVSNEIFSARDSILEHEHYMSCLKRSLGILVSNDMAEVSQAILKARRK